jgi:surfactin synthase thioesterase subunit
MANLMSVVDTNDRPLAELLQTGPALCPYCQQYPGRPPDSVTRVQSVIDNDVRPASNSDGGSRNLVGYSYGSIVAAQTALQMAQDGVVVDNLILVGSPVPESSALFAALRANSNIRSITRIDIANDPASDGDFSAAGVVWDSLTTDDAENPHLIFLYQRTR